MSEKNTLQTPADATPSELNDKLLEHQRSIVDRLRDLGVETLKVEIQGGNDESSIYKIEALPSELDLSLVPFDPHNARPGSGETVDDEIERFTYDVMEELLPRFDEDNGSTGELVINVSDGSMTMEVNEFYEEDVAGDGFSGPIGEIANLFSRNPGNPEGIPSFTSLLHRDPKEAMAIFKALAEGNVKSIKVDYFGCGDSGEDFEVHLDNKDDSSSGLLSDPDLEFPWTNYIRCYTENNDFYLKQGMELIEFEGAKWLKRTESIDNDDLPSLINDLMHDLISSAHAGYENNEGGGGSLTLNLEGMTVSHEPYNVEVKAHTTKYHFDSAHDIISARRDRPRLSSGG